MCMHVHMTVLPVVIDLFIDNLCSVLSCQINNTLNVKVFLYCRSEKVNKFSSVPYDDENLKCKFCSTSNNKNVKQKAALLHLPEATKIKQHENFNRRKFL